MTIRFNSTLSSCLISLLLIGGSTASAQTNKSVLQDIGIEGMKAEGWMKEVLTTQRNGLTGHIQVAGAPFDKEGWGDATQKKMDRWEDFEQTGYWADGALRCGYLIDDPELTQRVKEWIDFQIDHPKEDGFIGPELHNLWPHVVFFRVIMAEYSRNPSPKIIKALSNHYKNAARSQTLIKTGGPEWDFNERTMLHIEMLCWLYQQTNDAFFIEKAENTYKAFCSRKSPFTMQAFLSDEVPIVHSVSSFETLKIPVILYINTGKKEYLDAAIHGIQKVYKYHGLADGIPSGNEAHDGNMPNEVHETCCVSDAQWALGYFLQATGDVQWADLMEKICFNAAFSVVWKDFKSLQYYSSPNQVIAKNNSSFCMYVGGQDRMAYRIAHGPACCNGNMNRMIPLFCSRQWMKKGDNGIVAAMYAPSSFTTKLKGSKNEITIQEETNYPFEETIRFRMKMKRSTPFSFWLRIPQWCKGASITVNGQAADIVCKAGTFVEVQRKFSDGDIIELKLPMKAKSVSMPYDGVAFERGPLVFSLNVKAQEEITETRELDGIKFQSRILTPLSEWNYAPVDTENIEVVNSNDYSNIWNPEMTPVRLKVKAVTVTNWQLYRDNFTPYMPSVIRKGEEKVIELVPVGTTVLRMTVFPDIRRIPE
ncbi:glycoside hydrolase family 127 protein [Bacteroides thetaiotaomicron]|uniref:glycoside hydrolase family 127 protein n=1 Tax=Bacteroides thetaiotaomicron TaxID=818 RepID=UPI0021663A6B|nr:glycoside hydrolase family 127 protein [Bacteroides thetaiotaomicron]MCS2713883.1 glycoside hydrolase family 127 protein [Bacteroides thetaiotaomicron]MCS2874092.1 glycoside hydrolase family 127 protein [Bacteroides thetaiotaomicron]